MAFTTPVVNPGTPVAARTAEEQAYLNYLNAGAVTNRTSGDAETRARQAAIDAQYGGGGTPGTTGTQAQRDALAYVTDLLEQYGLGSLAGWAWTQIIGGMSEVQVIQSMRTQQAYLNRFPAMALRRQAGLAPISEGEYVAFERSTAQLMRAAGMPEGFYDTPDDFTNLLARDVSVNEMNQRVTNAYTRVAQAPKEVRDAFTSFYGADGNVALAAFILDPDKSMPFLERAITESEIAGTGQRFGVGIGQPVATRLAELGVNLDRATQGFGQINEMQDLFRESVTEGTDLTAADTGVGAVFGTSITAASELRRRREARQAAFSGAGGPAATRSGTGLGTSDLP